MQRFFRNLPIRVKLTVSILAASFLVLVLFGSVFLAVEIHAFRKSTINEVSVLASVLSITATKDLMLKRHRAAITTLDSLEAQPHIRAAFIFDT